MVCPTTAFAAWDSTNLCVVLSFISVEIAEMLGEEAEDMRIRLPLVVNDLCAEVVYDMGATHLQRFSICTFYCVKAKFCGLIFLFVSWTDLYWIYLVSEKGKIHVKILLHVLLN